jgi:hypothetical protein
VATQSEVTQLYSDLLGRAPDAGGLQFYMGKSLDFARNDISNSPERQAYASKQSAAPAAVDPEATYRQGLQDQVGGLFNEAETSRRGMQNPVDVYNSTLNNLGITDARTRVTDSRQALINSEALLKALPGDVQARTMDYNVSENQRRHLLATEQAPVVGQIDTQNNTLQTALDNYNMILGEGKTKTDYNVQGQQAARQALMDNLEVAISRSNDAEQKRQWQSTYDRLKAQDAEEKRQFDLNYSLEQKKTAISAANSSSSNASASKALTNAIKSVSATILDGGYRGSDGYIGPSTYKTMKSEWTAAGYNAKDFDSNFKQYANTAHLKDYGL